MAMAKDTTVSHYKILLPIGKGGMGEVYLAQDTELDRKVAIKFLNEDLSKDSEKVNRFIQEAKAASALNHPNILTVHEIGESGGSRYIVLEYVEGETLTSFLTKSHKFGAALEIATQIASALDAAHSAGIVHRDIKPDNVMIRPDGVVKLLDFGIAKLTEKPEPDVEPEGETAVQVKTSPGMVIGTANYMSPEQAKGRKVDTRTDIFSFGVVLYEMVSGRLPFEGESPLEIIGSILNKEPKPLPAGEIPADLVKLIGKCLRKDPDGRYQTMKGLLADLKETKSELEFQEKLDRTIQPERAEPDTQGFQGTTASDAQQSTASGNTNDSITIRRSSIGKVLIGVAALLVLTVIGVGYWLYSGTSGSTIESIAVMPFANETGKPDLEYLADGMTESLITSLSQIPDLSVKARSSVFRFKGKEIGSAQIGSELGVQALLTGRLTPNGEGFTLRLELVDAKDETVVWADSFDKKLDDLVSLQKQIAEDVSKKLRTSLSADAREKLVKAYSGNPEAHRAYLQGRFYWEKRNVKGFGNAKQYFQRAIELDPDYALAYVGLADTYQLIPVYDPEANPKDYMPLARQAAERAIRLDPDLAEAHASLGRVLFAYYYDFAASERSLKRALELDPNYATVHMWYSEYLGLMEKHEEELAEIRKAVDLEPFSLVFNRLLAGSLANNGKYDEAVAQLKKTVELFPSDDSAKRSLANQLVRQGNNEDAVSLELEAQKLRGIDPEWLETLQKAADKDGWNGYQKKYAEYGEEQRRKTGHFSATTLAEAYAFIGEKSKAIEELNRAFNERDPDLPYLKQTIAFESLRGDPGFKEIVRKVGLPE